jgi:choline dehydrogenase-like flavoprotein
MSDLIQKPRFFQPRAREMTDVVIIGCGAGGGVLAKELGEAGLRVIVLEAGKRFNPYVDYRTTERDFEVSATRVFDPEDPRRDLYTSGGADWFNYSRAKGVGGSTLVYVGVSPRFHESDFRVRSTDGVADDWPLTYADLEPYYTRVEYEIGISGPSGAEANPFDPPRSRPFPLPPFPYNCASQVIKRGADRLGLHMVHSPVALPSRPWNGRPASVQCGGCRLGCKIGAKGSIDVTYVRKAEATGRVDIRPQCMAREITVGADGKARSVIYFDADRRQQEVEARAIIIAGNAVETPRLLLLSQSSRFPNGLANSSGLVGKYFTEHLAVFTYAVFDERVDTYRGIPAGGMIQDFYATDKRNNFARGFTVEVNNGWQWPFSVAQRVPGWGASHKQRVKELFGHMVGLASVGDQLPDLRNEVSLDPNVKDLYGLPAPRIVNEPRANDQEMLKAIRQRFDEVLQAAGAREIWEPEYRPGGSSHYLGTCRMGSDPRTSVVDPWCRTHDVPNLFIGDSSPFVTGAGVNPALTISALATRTAEGIIAAFKRGEL